MGIFEIYQDTSEGRKVLECLACIDGESVKVYAMMKYGKEFTGVRGSPFALPEKVKPFDWEMWEEKISEYYRTGKLGEQK